MMRCCIWFQVIEMPEHNPGQMGGTMRLGQRKTIFKKSDCLMSESYIQILAVSIVLLLSGPANLTRPLF